MATPQLIKSAFRNTVRHTYNTKKMAEALENKNHYFFLKHFSRPESGILEFDWLLTRVSPVQFFPIRTGFVMDHWMKVEKQHTSVEHENFLIYGSKMRLFW